MSHNDNNPGTSARNHKPAIIAIVVALLVALVAFMVFTPGANEQNDGIATTAPPADTPISDAEGTEGSDAQSTGELPAEDAPATPEPAN